MIKNTPIYIAADTPNIEDIKHIAALAQEAKQGLKLGLEFFNANGPQGVSSIIQAYPNLSIFLDLKYHDIPNTVRAAVREVSKRGIDYLNIHASGGVQMMEYALEGAQEGAKEAGIKTPRVLGVTVLTSLAQEDLNMTGISSSPQEHVTRLAKLTKDAGLSGIVCSAHEIEHVRHHLGTEFVLMVPGIRPAGSDKGDQKRIMSPKEALNIGATHLVIGRPITAAPAPEKALRDILDELT